MVGKILILFFFLSLFFSPLKAHQEDKITAKEKIEALSMLARTYEFANMYIDAVDYYSKALDIAQAAPDKENEIDLTINIGRQYLSLKVYNKAIKYFRKALTEAKQFNINRGIGKAYKNIGKTYLTLLSFDKAEEYLLKAILTLKNTEHLEELAEVYRYFGILNMELQQFDNALERFMEAFKIYENQTDVLMMAEVVTEIAEMYLQMGDKRTAKKYITTALNSLQQTKNAELKAILNFYLVKITLTDKSIYLKQTDYEKFNSELKNSLSVFFENYNYENVIKCYNLMAKLELLHGDFKLSSAMLDSAHHYSAEYKLINFQEETYRTEASLHEKIGNLGKSNQLLWKLAEFNDSVTFIKLKEKEQKLRVGFQLEKNEIKAQLIRKELDIIDLKNKNEEIIKIVFISCLIILLILFVTLYFFKRRTKNTEK